MVATCVLAFAAASATARVGTGGLDARSGNVLPFAASSIPTSHQPIIIGGGEASHGGEAMLTARNHLIHELAERGRISTVALETGYAEALLLDRYVRGGPGMASEVAAKGFTWGFGNLSGNVALLEDLRAINARKPANKQIGIVGIDMSLGGPFGSAPTMAAVNCALDGVRDAALRESLRASFSTAVIPGLTRPEVSNEAKAAFYELSRKLTASIEHDAPESVRECAVNVSESAAVLDALPTLPGDHGIPADAWRSISQRDQATAANVLTALSLARGGNILLFAHTSHILNAPMRGRRFSGQQQPPQSMGSILRRSLGSRYLAIAQIEPVTPAPADPPPDLFELLHPTCSEACMIRPVGLQGHEVRIGINGNDEQLIDPMTAASFYLILPEPSKRSE
jgi:erythromycin esterase-like protein